MSAPVQPLMRQTDDSLASWKQQQEQARTFLKSLRPIGTLHFQELFQLRRNNGWIELVSRTADMADNVSMMATFDDIPGSAEVYVHRKPATGILDRFELNLMDFPSERRAIDVRVHLDADKGQFSISQTNQNNGAIEQIMLEQYRPALSGPSNFIQIHVLRSSMNNVQSEQLSYGSPDFSSFIQNRPEETAKYLRPMLRELGQEMIFAPDARTAEQVLGGLRRGDPAIQKQVEDLLPAFNDSNFHARNAASAKLKSLGRAAADVLDRMDRSMLSPEQNLRIDSFLAHYNPLSAKEIAKLRRDPTFLLDCLYSEKSDVRWAALDQLRNTFNPTLDFDPDAPDDARNSAIAALRRRLTPGQ